MRLPSAVARKLRQEAQRSYPREACGFLIGSCAPVEGSLELDDAARQDPRVSLLRPARNVAERPDRYFIVAEEVWEALREARDADLELLGVYHSHPDAGAAPSPTDRDEAWGGWLYLIVPCVEGQAGVPRCWRWQESGFVAVEVEIEGEVG